MADLEPATAARLSNPTTYPVRFTGVGAEYFRIWIVNLLLTIVTLGIYSAWAKVRKMQYFYRNIEFAGARFEYHGRPLAILKGRAIAFVLFALYYGATREPGALSVVAVVLVAAIMPWLLWRSFRFRLAVSSYRGVRFSFRGTVGGAYAVFLGWPVLSAATFGLLSPLAYSKLKHYLHSNAYYGDASFDFDEAVGAFYRLFGVLFLMLIGLGVVSAAVLFGVLFSTIKASVAAGGQPSPVLLVLPVLVFYAIVFALAPYALARIQNLVWRQTTIEGHRFRCELSPLGYVGIAVVNIVAIVCTLGLFTPFAQIRAARAKLDALALEMRGDFEAYIAQLTTHLDRVGATGDSMAEMFDIDIAL